MNPLQRAATRRKIYYFAAILCLFTVSMVWRGTIPVPLSGSARAATWLNNRSILNQSAGLELLEREQGEVDVESEGMRLALVGSRGIVVTFLWHSAIEAQKRNDFHEMEGHIRTVTQLQPHFITPWIFQSWNIAYNVSVEMQGSGDMYFYIARGIELLAEGERRNVHTYRDPSGQERKVGSPDMRYQIAFYYQNKFGVSDQVEVLRCLFQLSCIPKNKRNPDDFIDPVTGEVKLEEFRRFCEEYPHLVRRLRGEDRRGVGGDERTSRQVAEALKCPTPKDVIDFLRVNREVPTRYVGNGAELAPARRQFPVLPPKPEQGEEAHPGSETKDDFSAYKAARAWFAYSVLSLPENPRDASGKPYPAGTPYPAVTLPPKPGEYDPFRDRVPRQPMLIIFRQGVPRVQTSQAEMEQKEGWFDNEGWRIDDPTDPGNWWFPDPAAPTERPLPVVVGRERSWSLEEWRKAFTMWEKHGQDYALELERTELDNLEELARKTPSQILTEDEEPTDPVLIAQQRLFFYHQNRRVTNFATFLAVARAECREENRKKVINGKETNELESVPITVRARKTLWLAEQQRKIGNKFGSRGAIALYRDGLEQWKYVIKTDARFHRPGNSRTEEETYNYELAYLRLLVEDDDDVRREASAMSRKLEPLGGVFPSPLRALWETYDFRFPWFGNRVVRVSPFAGEAAQVEFRWYIAEELKSPLAGLITDRDVPLNDERRGTPWVGASVKQAVRMSQGVPRRSDIQQQPTAPSAVPGQ